MKKQYAIIILLLIWTVVMIVKPILESLPNQAQKEYETYMREMFEESRTVEAQFDDVVTYCKEHEKDFMIVSEMFFGEFYADITPQEIAEIAQNNTLPEWVELSKAFSLNHGNFIGADEGIYYHYKDGGGSSLGVLYIDDHTNPSKDIFLHKIYKVNDYLYVCIYRDPMVGI